MKYLLALLIMIVLSDFSRGQNVVPNPGFEEDTACPYALNQIYFCKNWTTGNEGTPDYFNICDTNSVHGSGFAVPANWMGYQRAFEGAAYAGIYGYSEAPIQDYHEYLMVKIPPLDSGVAYRVSMEVSLADSSGYESDGLGILFNTYGGYQGVTTIPLSPQINFNSFGVITNTTGWTRLSGTLVPDSAFTYMVIGVFKDAGQLFKVPIKSPPFFRGFSYYYVDSIIVEKIVNAGVSPGAGNISTCLYPNPLISGSAVLSFDNPLREHYSLFLNNVYGQVVKRWPDITSGSVEIAREWLSNGFYYYLLQNENGVVGNGKIIVGN